VTHVIDIERDKVAGFMRSFANGLPIDAPEGGWTGQDMLMLASAAFAGVIDEGPQDWSTIGETPPNLRGMPFEHAEARFATFVAEVLHAIDLGWDWCLSIRDGEEVPDEVAFVVKQAPSGNCGVKQVLGDEPDDDIE
jgi:hypothetical protein